MFVAGENTCKIRAKQLSIEQMGQNAVQKEIPPGFRPAGRLFSGRCHNTFRKEKKMFVAGKNTCKIRAKQRSIEQMGQNAPVFRAVCFGAACPRSTPRWNAVQKEIPPGFRPAGRLFSGRCHNTFRKEKKMFVAGKNTCKIRAKQLSIEQMRQNAPVFRAVRFGAAYPRSTPRWNAVQKEIPPGFRPAGRLFGGRCHNTLRKEKKMFVAIIKAARFMPIPAFVPGFLVSPWRRRSVLLPGRRAHGH